MSDLTDRLDQIKARAGAATKGPWEVCAFDSGHSEFEMSVSVITASAGDRICDMDGLGRTLNEIDARDDGVADAEFIAHARTDVPALVAALRAVLDLKSEYGSPRFVLSTDLETTITEALNG